MKPKIFIFANTKDIKAAEREEWVPACAIAEDGTGLAGHVCSAWGFVAHDMGIGSTWKHEIYDKHYPDGWELVLVRPEEIATHEEINAALRKCAVNWREGQGWR